MSNENQNNISWEAWEFQNYEKSPAWYISITGIALLVVVFFAYVQSDIFAAVSIALIAILFIIFSAQKPQRVGIELNSKSVKIGNLSYPYKQIKYFWVVYNERHRTINFHTSAFVNNVLILELESQNPEQARNFLLKYLPEHSETEETPIQKIAHKFKI
jgi:hypothetical protein